MSPSLWLGKTIYQTEGGSPGSSICWLDGASAPVLDPRRLVRGVFRDDG